MSEAGTMALSYGQAHALIESRGFGIKPDLSRISALVELLDNPQLTYPTIHLAGTNGKSSTARITASILAGHGLNTGVYLSPHLETVRERFALAGWGEQGLIWEEIGKQAFAEVVAYLLPFVELVESRSDEQMSFFELTSALAFEWMAERSVAAGVVEAGMGGRWDATNVIEAAVAILTPIDVDHTEFLGHSPMENASEKVEIIKPGSAVVSSFQHPEVEGLIRELAKRKGATLSVLGTDLHIRADTPAARGRLVTIETPLATYEDLFLPLYGSHQTENLALAIRAAESLIDRSLEDASLRRALEAVRSPGRMEVVRSAPPVILDGAHNPHGAAALAGAIRDQFPGRRITLVLSVLKDKDARGIIRNLAGLAELVIYTRCNSPRAADPRELAATPEAKVAPSAVIESFEEAVDYAVGSALDDDIVLVTGSLVAVGQARRYLRR
jgi:dihydrofolate synthase / folylpolyglutamate synthase